MKKTPFPLVPFIVFLFLEVAVFVSQKYVAVNASGHGAGFYLSLLAQPYVWISLAFALAQFFFWIHILEKADLSMAYTMSSLGYPLIMLAAVLLFHESLSVLVWIGGGLITAGVIVVGTEPEQEPEPSNNGT